MKGSACPPRKWYVVISVLCNTAADNINSAGVRHRRCSWCDHGCTGNFPHNLHRGCLPPFRQGAVSMGQNGSMPGFAIVVEVSILSLLFTLSHHKPLRTLCAILLCHASIDWCLCLGSKLPVLCRLLAREAAGN